MHNMKSARSKHIWEKYILPEFLQKYKMDTHINPVALVKVKETQKQTLSSDISVCPQHYVLFYLNNHITFYISDPYWCNKVI